jgi:hypothetical protein
MTTSHLTDEATSHSTWLSKDDNQVAGYAVLRRRGKQASRVADARKKFLAYIPVLSLVEGSIICGATKFFSSGQPKGYPTLKLRFPRLADDSARAAFARSGSTSLCGAFGRTLYC